MIKIRKLIKTFGQRVVLRGIDLDIAPGEFITLLGANGAGKTTLLNIIATLSQPDAGLVQISGLDLAQYAAQIRRYIGYVTHKPLLYEDLSGLQNLQFYAKLYDVPDSKARIEAVLAQVNLLNRQNDMVRTYSRGMQQRLAIARAVLHNPPILLLDEPDTGLDQQADEILTSILGAVEVQRRTVLMTSHNLARSVSLGSRMIILAQGKIQQELDATNLSLEAVQAAYWQAQSLGQAAV